MAAAEEQFDPIYKGRDFYVPAFDIQIEGKDLKSPVAKDIIEVRYTDSLDKIDTMELTLNNWDADKLDFKYTGSKKGGLDENSRLFLPGQVIELSMGYFSPIAAGQSRKNNAEPLRLMLAGSIHKLAPTFPTAGQPTVKVSGRSVLSQLIGKQETFHYDPSMFQPEKIMKPSLIAKRVGDRGNLKLGKMVVKVRINNAALAKEPALQYVLQEKQYDIVFLLQLAHRCGYNLVLKKEAEGDKQVQYLQFGPPASSEPRVSYILEWGRTLIQFQPTLNTAEQVMEVTVQGWNVKTKKPIKVTVDRTMLPNSPYRNEKDLEKLEEGFKEKKEIIIDRPFLNEEEARRYALGQLTTIAGKMVTAHGSTLGSPNLRAGSRIEVRGLGEMFDGKYMVTSSSHVIGASGYVTEFDAHLEDKPTA